jgi:hypothetical protein
MRTLTGKQVSAPLSALLVMPGPAAGTSARSVVLRGTPLSGALIRRLRAAAAGDTPLNNVSGSRHERLISTG